VDALWGVGPKTAARLRASGIDKLVDVRQRPIAELQEVVGSAAEWLRDLSFGIDDRPVDPSDDRKSAGSECTYEHDLKDLDRIRHEIDGMARDAARWLESHAIFARTVVIKVRYDDFTTITRSHSEPKPTRDPELLAARALSLLERTEAGRRPVRLLGVSVHNLEETDAVRAKRTLSPAMPRLPLD
jgi:DNA polymerase-4